MGKTVSAGEIAIVPLPVGVTEHNAARERDRSVGADPPTIGSSTQTRARSDSCRIVPVYGLRRRKNCELFVAGMVTDLWAPSSVTVAELVTQPAGAASRPACSNAKPAVSTAGQETVTFALERSTESVGIAGR